MFQVIFERVTKEHTASASIAMKIRVVAPPEGRLLLSRLKALSRVNTTVIEL